MDWRHGYGLGEGMSGVRSAIFPGILAGSVFVIMMSAFISSSPILHTADVVKANSVEVENQTENSLSNTWDASCAISAGYPQSIQQWCPFITSYAAKNGLDANLVAAVILQESAGNQQAYSHSGAVGLMQVMPRDGLAASFMCINGPCFANRPSMDELFDPEFNISYGTRMLAGLIQKNGNVRDALKAYGPKDVGYYYADIVLGIYNQH